MCCCCFFFFKQKTAYEMRISDWSSDVGSSDLYRIALGAAPTTSTVLILGENGTGKELVARAIHQHSLRSERPLRAINCGAIPESLVETEIGRASCRERVCQYV